MPSYYLTISHRRRGDYKLIFTEPQSGEVNIITEPEATNSFSINFQANIMSLSCKFCVYLHFTPLFLSIWCKHELRKRQSKFL